MTLLELELWLGRLLSIPVSLVVPAGRLIVFARGFIDLGKAAALWFTMLEELFKSFVDEGRTLKLDAFASGLPEFGRTTLLSFTVEELFELLLDEERTLKLEAFASGLPEFGRTTLLSFTVEELFELLLDEERTLKLEAFASGLPEFGRTTVLSTFEVVAI